MDEEATFVFPKKGKNIKKWNVNGVLPTKPNLSSLFAHTHTHIWMDGKPF